MVEKESGWVENPEFQPLWTPKITHGVKRFITSYSVFSSLYAHIHCLFRYYNTVDGHSQHHPPPLCLGGLFADVSKTISDAQ